MTAAAHTKGLLRFMRLAGRRVHRVAYDFECGGEASGVLEGWDAGQGVTRTEILGGFARILYLWKEGEVFGKHLPHFLQISSQRRL